MTEKIDVHDLSEDQIRLVLEFVEFLRQKRKKHVEPQKDINFAKWSLEVKGNLKRNEIYEQL